MPEETTDQSNLDFLSFVDFAVGKTVDELPEVDPVSMRLVLALHRVTSALVYDLESTVHRPSGWSWPGFRCCSCCGSPDRAKPSGWPHCPG